MFLYLLLFMLLDKEKEDGSSTSDGPVKGCPNTSNPYHTCVEYCWKRYGGNAAPPPPKVRNKHSFSSDVACVASISVGFCALFAV